MSPEQCNLPERVVGTKDIDLRALAKLWSGKDGLGTIPAIGLIAGYLSLFAPLAAADESPDVVLQTFSVISVFKLPPWSNDPSIFEHSEVFRDQVESGRGTEFFLWETIPKGEAYESWSKLYAINAEYPILADIEGYVIGQSNIYADDCSVARKQEVDSIPKVAAFFIMYCESYNEQPEFGKISFYNMQLHNNTLVRLYYSVKVPRYTLVDADDVPMDVTEMRRITRHLGALRLEPVPEKS